MYWCMDHMDCTDRLPNMDSMDCTDRSFNRVCTDFESGAHGCMDYLECMDLRLYMLVPWNFDNFEIQTETENVGPLSTDRHM